MQGDYISISDFNTFKQDRAMPALAVVDVNLKNTNKINQVAARMLGYSSYEALQPLHKRERNITDGIHAEACPFQANKMTLKAGNILVVFDHDAQEIRFRALEPGQEQEMVTEDNQMGCISFNEKDEPTPDFNIKAEDIDQSDASGKRIAVTFMITHTNGIKEPNLLTVVRTDEGIIADVYYDIELSCEVYDSVGLMFSDAESEAYESVDQAGAMFNQPLSGSEGEFYQWLMPTVMQDGGDLRYLYVGNPDDRDNISTLMLPTYQEAVDAIRNEDFCYGWKEMEGAVIVRVNKTLAGKPTPEELGKED